MENPEKYAPQYGGYCANTLTLNKLVGTNPDAWTLHNGKLFLNNNLGGRKTWRKDKDGNIEKADNNWPPHLEKLLAKAK